MAQVFRCSHEGCDKEVRYEREEKPGGIGFQTRRLLPKEFVVYLTCPRGHVHPYTVKAQDEAGHA